jgi:aromatic amino acid aminotransferase I
MWSTYRPIPPHCYNMFREKIRNIEANRASSAPLPQGPVPYTSSNLFKAQASNHKPTAKSWQHRFSNYAITQKSSVLKASAMAPVSQGAIMLGTGRPSAEFYPWSSMTMRSAWTNDEKEQDMKATSSETGDQTYDLSVALNYGYAAGSPQLLRFVTEHIEMIHNPPYKDWECCLTSGTTSAIDVVFQILCNRGDWIVTEEHTYSGAIDAAHSQGLAILGIKMDEQGILPEAIDKKLSAWDEGRGRKPFLLYMIPTGQNPTGMTQSRKRREEIYKVAEIHDLLIIEDDPYYFLQLCALERELPTQDKTHSSVDQYVGRLQTSYLSLDVSGRVIRLDSTSKIIAPGLRCGWITASPQIIAKFIARTELSTVSPSGVSQVVMYKLLDETWGHDGFIQWLMHLSVRYRQRRDILVRACNRYLPMDLCSWILPTEGMFLWIRIVNSKVETTALENLKSNHDMEDRVLVQARDYGVLVTKGSLFRVEDDYPENVFFRLTFGAAPQHTLDRAVRLFGDAIRKVFELN